MFTKFRHNITQEFSISIFFLSLSLALLIKSCRRKALLTRDKWLISECRSFYLLFVVFVTKLPQNSLSPWIYLPSPNHFLLSRKIPSSRKIILFLSMSQALEQERGESERRGQGRGSLERKQPKALPSDGVGTQNFQAPVTNTFVVNILEFE